MFLTPSPFRASASLLSLLMLDRGCAAPSGAKNACKACLSESFLGGCLEVGKGSCRNVSDF